MNAKELNYFWSLRKKKSYVVTLSDKRGVKTDKLIVRATTSESALITAKRNSVTFGFGKKQCFGTARYAHPVSDLHCIKVEKSAASMDLSNLNDEGLAAHAALSVSDLCQQ